MQDRIRPYPQAKWMVRLIWNERKTSGTPFLEAYESVLKKYGADYMAVRHKRTLMWMHWRILLAAWISNADVRQPADF